MGHKYILSFFLKDSQALQFLAEDTQIEVNSSSIRNYIESQMGFVDNKKKRNVE